MIFSLKLLAGQAWLLLLAACLTPQKLARLSQGWVCLDSCLCCHTETEVAGQICTFTQSQCTDTELTSASTYLTMSGARQGGH